MPHVHFAWELGGGLGHTSRLAPLVREFERRGWRTSASLRDLTHAGTPLDGLALERYQAPVFAHRVEGVPMPQANMAEVLMLSGYVANGGLPALVDGWRNLFTMLRPDVVVMDFAPTAFLAARARGLPNATIGNCWAIPPDVAPLPSIRDWEPIAPGRLATTERQVLDVVNAALSAVGAAPLDRLAHLLRGDHPLTGGWPELDLFAPTPRPGEHWIGPTLLPAKGVPPEFPAVGGPRVFAYLKSVHPDHVDLLQALDRLGCATLCYMPEVAYGKPPPVRSERIAYAKGAVDLTDIWHDVDLCVCHGGDGTFCKALLGGVPLLLLPTQAEQFLQARQLERVGLGINAAQRPRPLDYVATIGPMLRESAWRIAARAFARAHAAFDPDAQVIHAVDAIAALGAPRS